MTTTRNSERAYGKSIIYKICCNDLKVKEVYVGSTTNFKNRKNDHKTVCCNEKSLKYNYKVYQFIRNNGGWNNWDMIQLEQYEAKTKLELHSRERYWIETLQSTLNCQIPLRTDSEWYICNKELITKQKKEYYNCNKELILERQKEYYEENKESIKEKKREKITCECGKKIKRCNKAKHEKSKQHLAYLKLNNNVIVEQCVTSSVTEFQK